jgi:hypothetical protein
LSAYSFRLSDRASISNLRFDIEALAGAVPCKRIERSAAKTETIQNMLRFAALSNKTYIPMILLYHDCFAISTTIHILTLHQNGEARTVVYLKINI